MKKYFQDHIVSLTPYIPGLQLNESGYIKLNTNENPYPPSNRAIARVRKSLDERIRLYPHPTSDNLRKKIADKLGFPMDHIIIGNGSDEILSLIVRAVIGEGDKVLLTYPTYVLYEVLVDIQKGEKVVIQLDQKFELSSPISPGLAKLAFFSIPNTPTGSCLNRGLIEQFCADTNAIVVIDEAYVDFAETNCVDLVNKFDNVIITRSLSKSYSLAGIRIGYALSRPDNIEQLLKIKDSYNVNSLSTIVAEAAIDDDEYMQKRVKMIVRDRRFLSEQLAKIGFEVLPSQANFIFVKHPNKGAKQIYQCLFDHQLLVRHFELPRLENYLRISIGTHQEVVKLLTVLKKIVV